MPIGTTGHLGRLVVESLLTRGVVLLALAAVVAWGRFGPNAF